MPWVRFTESFNYSVRSNVTISYKAGGRYLVKQECAGLAIAAHKAVVAERPPSSPRKVPDDAGR